MPECIITDKDGTRTVTYELRKRRGFDPAKDGRRFRDIKVGDQLMLVEPVYSSIEDRRRTTYWIVTDRWFDPVAGQRNASKGDMVAVQRLDHDGKPIWDKRGHTVRGLASQGYRSADRDWVEFAAARAGAMQAGNIVGIGAGRAIRKRPKTPNRTL